MSFGEYSAKIRLFRDDGVPLLRTPQHGAALAVAAHFTARTEPAAVALPTGVGKTAVMTVVPYLTSAKRALVLVPTRLLRQQIKDEFAGLRVLRRTGVAPQEIWSPKAAEIKGRADVADWGRLGDYDVVVSTPHSLIEDGVGVIPNDFFDLVLVDEAHHAPATMWHVLMAQTSPARQVLFTATPYRRDDLRIQATIVYEFSLADAISQEYVSPVDLEILDGDGDDALIQEVRRRITDPTSAYYQTPFIARTGSAAHAKDLKKKYAEAGIETCVILGETSLKKANEALNNVRSGETSGIIMVGVLGEGFDFPAIKIAAYHRAHQSLPATLQFVGRVSRVHPGGPERALVIATRQDGNSEIQELYQSDAQWANLIPELADRLFQREARRAMVERELQTPIQGRVSPANLKPRRVVDIYTVPADFNLHAVETLDTDDTIVQWWQTESKRFLVIIRQRNEKPKWLYSPVLIQTQFELQCAVHAPDEGLLFLSTDGDQVAFARDLGLEEPEPVHPQRLYAMLNAQGVEAYFNVGMRSVEIPNAKRASYMINAGPNVGETIRPDDSALYTLGHAVAKIRDADGSTHSFGIAVRKSRVWMAQSEPLADFQQWCMKLARLIHRSKPANMIDGISLRPEEPFELFPETAIAAMAGERLFEKEATFQWADGFLAHISDLVLEPQVSPDRTFCKLTAEPDSVHTLEIRVTPNTAEVTTAGITLFLEDTVANASHELTSDPFYLYFGDGSSSRGFLLSSPAQQVPAFPATSIEIPAWTDVDIKKETETNEPGKISIFDYMQEELSRRYPEAIIVNDDRAYELADILVMTDRGAHVDVMLLHCKGAPGAPSEQVEQLYVVAGQALRSMQWARHRAAFWKEVQRRHRERAAFDVISDPSGRADQWFAECAGAAPETRFHFAIAQPGLLQSALRIGTNPNILMQRCKSSADSVGAQFTVFCNKPRGAERA